MLIFQGPRFSSSVISSKTLKLDLPKSVLQRSLITHPYPRTAINFGACYSSPAFNHSANIPTGELFKARMLYAVQNKRWHEVLAGHAYNSQHGYFKENFNFFSQRVANFGEDVYKQFLNIANLTPMDASQQLADLILQSHQKDQQEQTKDKRTQEKIDNNQEFGASISPLSGASTQVGPLVPMALALLDDKERGLVPYRDRPRALALIPDSPVSEYKRQVNKI